MIKINKQLDRPDGGKVPSGSLIQSEPMFKKEQLKVIWKLTHWLSQSAIDSDKMPIPIITNFDYWITKQCTEEEFAKLNDAGSAELVENWLKEIIDASIGLGYTEIV